MEREVRILHRSVQKVHGGCTKGAQRCAEGSADGAKAWAEWVEWVWWVQAQCTKKVEKTRKKKKIRSVPVLTGLTTKNRLSVDEGRVVVVAQGQGMGGGYAK